MAVLCFTGLFLQDEQPLWQWQRDTRKAIMLTMIGLSCVVEACVLQDKRLAATIAVGKVLAFNWFRVYGRYDAPRRSVFTVPGVWLDHDVFHLISTAIHGLQLLGVSQLP